LPNQVWALNEMRPRPQTRSSVSWIPSVVTERRRLKSMKKNCQEPGQNDKRQSQEKQAREDGLMYDPEQKQI